MIRTWGLDLLQSGSGVIDVGGEPGFVAMALLERGVPTIVVDPSWGLTGKTNRLNEHRPNDANAWLSKVFRLARHVR